jgi:hypothetical protein
MDMPIRFDIAEYTKTLTESGVPLDQAEAHALALSRALSEGTPASSELVLVKHELLMRIDMLKQEVNARMDLLKQELTQEFDAKLAQLRAELLSKISWFGGLSLAGTLLNSGMLIYLIASHHL